MSCVACVSFYKLIDNLAHLLCNTNHEVKERQSEAVIIAGEMLTGDVVKLVINRQAVGHEAIPALGLLAPNCTSG